MSKIVQAVNSMIANSNLISKVIKNDNEIYFIYKEKYKWSIVKRNGEVALFYYPGNIDFEYLASLEDFDGVDIVHYSDKEIGTKEAKASFIELYDLINGKVYEIDSVLDDIISDSEDS